MWTWYFPDKEILIYNTPRELNKGFRGFFMP
nr:MAG TPA: hypothetical protein [Caudoviricetes sp.]DAW48383.1 MAG TPA: hypothetical protein [Caudoviricetes sp.]